MDEDFLYVIVPYFMSLSNAVGMKYIGIIGKEVPYNGEKLITNTPQANRTFEVNILQLKKIIDNLI
jgi:hypothetical protein